MIQKISLVTSFIRTVKPGDLLYFPDRFWHAIINLDPYTTFVSTFTTEHGFAERQTDELYLDEL